MRRFLRGGLPGVQQTVPAGAEGDAKSGYGAHGGRRRERRRQPIQRRVSSRGEEEPKYASLRDAVSMAGRLPGHQHPWKPLRHHDDPLPVLGAAQEEDRWLLQGRSLHREVLTYR